MIPAFLVVFAFAAGAVLLGWLYFRRYALVRPPLGVFKFIDVATMIGAIIAMPYLYLWLPLWLTVGLLALGIISILYCTIEPLLRNRWIIWFTVMAIVSADAAIGLWLAESQGRVLFFLMNNFVLLVTIVGLTNLWVQSGMKARDATVLGVVLAVYDFLVTSMMTLTTDLITRLASSPFVPLVAWQVDERNWLGIGLGDLLLATAFPLVMRKAFGRAAGIVALAIALAMLGVLLSLPGLGILHGTFPVMAILGPLMGLQYLYWVRQCGHERTTWQYLQAEPLRRQAEEKEVRTALEKR